MVLTEKKIIKKTDENELHALLSIMLWRYNGRRNLGFIILMLEADIKQLKQSTGFDEEITLLEKIRSSLIKKHDELPP